MFFKLKLVFLRFLNNRLPKNLRIFLGGTYSLLLSVYMLRCLSISLQETCSLTLLIYKVKLGLFEVFLTILRFSSLFIKRSVLPIVSNEISIVRQISIKGEYWVNQYFGACVRLNCRLDLQVRVFWYIVNIQGKVLDFFYNFSIFIISVYIAGLKN